MEITVVGIRPYDAVQVQDWRRHGSLREHVVDLAAVVRLVQDGVVTDLEANSISGTPAVQLVPEWPSRY